ncbi:hypothetical protein GCM10027022_04600 [Alpinimonas psychrophila]
MHGASGNLGSVNVHPESEANEGLMSTLSVVEDQPLDQRAEGYTQLYDALRTQLEGGDLPSRELKN